MMYRQRSLRLDDARAIRDAEGCCHGAGDLLPTNPQQLRTAVYAEDQNWDILNRQVVDGIMATKITVPFANAFNDKRFAWKYFASTILTDTPVFNTTAVEQLQEWKIERSKWAGEIEKLTGIKTPGPVGDAPPPPTTQTADMTKLVIAMSALAALVILGPKLSKFL